MNASLKPKKITNPKATAVEYLARGDYLIGKHALERMYQREIDISDISSVIMFGNHVPKRDRLSAKNQWSYCFEGKDFDKQRLIRLIAAFEELMFVITVIDISR